MKVKLPCLSKNRIFHIISSPVLTNRARRPDINNPTMSRLFSSLILSVIALTGYAQSATVSGIVKGSDDGEPLIGVSVTVKGGSAGTMTDIDGHYTITVTDNSTLTYSYVGYESQERKIKGSQTIDITLDPASDMLDDLVVVGYGMVKKSDLTGSVASVNSDKLTKTPAASLSNALQGQVAGVTVNSLTGRPGAGAEVRIRGVGTVNGSSPIYVVDGVIADNIDFLSPNDIEHLEVLKDASATAIYGSRGANGVIIVTTRGGALSQPTHVTFSGYIGAQHRWKKLDVMNAREYADAYVAINGNAAAKKVYAEQGFNSWLNLYQGLRSSSYYPTVYNADTNPDGFDYSTVDTDWQEEVFRTGLIQNYHLSIDGGTDRSTYSVSGSWFGQEGIIIGSDYSRFTGRINTTFQAFPWLKIGENITFKSSIARNAYESGDNSESAGANIISAAFAMAPWDPTRYPAGYTNRDGEDMGGRISAGSAFKNVTNPLSMIEYSHPKVNNERFVGNAFLELTPVKHFNFRSSFSFDYSITRDKSFSDAYEVSAYDKRQKNFLSSSLSRSAYWNVDNILTYNNNFGRHSLTAMAGFTVEEYNYYSIGNSGSSILNPDEKNWYLSQVTDDFGTPGDNVSRNRRQSWLGRVNYSFDSRYLLTVNFRADGSSRFAENRWGYFPSFAAAWRLSNDACRSDVE